MANLNNYIEFKRFLYSNLLLITVGVISILTCLLHTVLEFEATAIRGSSGSIVHTRYPVALQGVGQVVDQTQSYRARFTVTTERPRILPFLS